MTDIGGIPGLTIFLWQDGAIFDGVMNQYMSANYPVGIDPTSPTALTRNGSHALSLDDVDVKVAMTDLLSV